MYVCMCVCIYVCMYACMHVYTSPPPTKHLQTETVVWCFLSQGMRPGHGFADPGRGAGGRCRQRCQGHAGLGRILSPKKIRRKCIGHMEMRETTSSNYDPGNIWTHCSASFWWLLFWSIIGNHWKSLWMDYFKGWKPVSWFLGGTLDHGTDGFQGDGLWWISQIYRSFLVIPFSYTYFEIYKTYKTPQKPWLGRGCTRTWD